VLRKSLVKNSLQSRSVAVGVMAISGVLLVAAALVMFWEISRDGDPTSQATTVVFEVSVPQELSLTEYSSGFMDDGAPLELSGSTVSLQFQGGYLEAIELPILHSSGQLLASFSDNGAGIYLEQDGAGQMTFRFPLFSNQGGVPLTITGAVEDIQPQEQGSKLRISLGSMEAEAEFSVVQATDGGLPSIEKVRLAFELHRLPKAASLTVSLSEELDRSTRSEIDPTLDEGLGTWTVALAVEARRANMENGYDVGEAALYLTLPDLGMGLMESLVVVHVDDEGRAERLESEVVSSVDGRTVIRFLSPGGLSIFALMVPDNVLAATPVPTSTADAIVTLTPIPSVLLTPTTFPGATATATPVPTFTPTAAPRPTPTATSTTVPTSTADAIVTPVPTSTADAIVTPVPTFTATAEPRPTATATAAAIATVSHTPTQSPVPTVTTTLVPTELPTPTPSPLPTSTPRPTPTKRPPISTPIPVPDEHYAVIVHTTDPVRQQWLLDTLGTRWFLDWSDNVDVIPSGHDKMVVIDLPGPSSQVIQDIAQQAPGSVWYVVGEPNRRAGYSAGDIVTQLHDLYGEIKLADETARITSPSILNWEFTCAGCGAGFQKGSTWVEEFRAAYMDLYGEEPPVDIWAIDVYPLDWLNRPTVDHQLAIDQVSGLRQYLDETGLQDKPIWITELGLHWGYDDWVWGLEGCTIDGAPIPSPAGEYQTEQVISYLGKTFDWLEANAESKSIEKWFLFSTYKGITKCNSSAYAGLTLFDTPETGASLTEVGQFFRDRVLGID
jgi:hypothetical protein